jgi:Trypsin-like peptidase domain/TIR domain
MEQPLRELVKLCTVRLLVKGRSQGTGFFVAPGFVLTCAHVVRIAQEKNLPIEIYSWDGQSLGQVYVIKEKYFLEAIPVKDAITDPKLANLYPDLALLQVTEMDHPFVYLDSRVSYNDALFSYGYTEVYPSGDGAEFVYEDESWIDSQRPLLKFREGQALSGLSGGPLLNLHTGSVCGVVQKTRTGNIGGRAIPTKIVFQHFPELQTMQKQFHQQDTRWVEKLTAQQKQALGLVSSSSNLPQKIEVFYSFADTPKDKKMLEELLKHLSTLRRQGYITDWYPGKVSPGEKPSEEVMNHLESARIILLLISPDYVSSDELAGIHVRRAMERHSAKEPDQKATVIPILLRSIDNWKEEPFGDLLAIPRNGKPISKWTDSDEAFAEVAKEIRRVVSNVRNAKSV